MSKRSRTGSEMEIRAAEGESPVPARRRALAAT